MYSKDVLTKAKVWHGLPIVRITKLVLGENKLYKTYICYLPAGRFVLKNIFQRSQKRPETEGRGTLLRPRENIFQVRADLITVTRRLLRRSH